MEVPIMETLDDGGKLTRAEKKKISDDDLFVYFCGSLSAHKHCGNKLCNCLNITKIVPIRRVVAKYLVWFERKSKEDQDGILLEWYKFARRDGSRTTFYNYNGNGEGDQLSGRALKRQRQKG